MAGPLVIPGRTSCLRCADLHRTDRDPAWPALAVQLATPPRHRLGSDVATVSLIAGVTAVQALSYLDSDLVGLRTEGRPSAPQEQLMPAVANGTLEVQLPDWRVRRRSWLPHPHCDCGAYGRDTSRDGMQ